MFGFGESPNSPIPHRIYEFKIPFELDGRILGRPGESIDFASPPTPMDSLPYDWNGGSPRCNIWPRGADIEDPSTWGILFLAIRPVGGIILPVDKIASLAPYITTLTAALATTMGVTVAVKKQRILWLKHINP